MASSRRRVWLRLAVDLLVWSAASAEALQQPSINLTSPDDGLVWGPDGARITRGHSFSFTCSVGSGHPPGQFSLVFSRSNERLDQLPAVNNVASFHFPAADYHHQGNYSCLYEDTVSPGNFPPLKTEPIVVFITAAVPLWVVASSIAGGALVFLLLVLMGVALICWTRRSLDVPKAIVQTQPTATGSFQENDYDEEEDDDDDDYMNVDQDDSQLNPRQHAQRPHSEEEDDDDDDYMNVDQEDSRMDQRQHAPRPHSDGEDENVDFQDNYVVAMELRSVSARGEAEDGEGSSDENEYINVSNFVTEQAVDTRRDMQDIYENFKVLG
ncbi:uncharacterized protein LOC115385576 [Salarias fasciatus]|uniref:uncharacterized protein LOC115385576 n=1 Tax=Salarias fasciatus TaxID=181472 RepID=UPI0011766939|nr:uncharacterized protein LOC115385576 [Salarias fasciatus]XP_029943500.1 uncharacterized protein LOC115385576 [Salarias fasciatus]